MSKLSGGPESKVPRMAPQRTAGAWRNRKFFYFGLRVPSRCAASLWVTSLGTRIQCGGTLSPLPSGRDSVGIGGDVQWNGLTVLYTTVYWSVDSLLTSELAGGLYDCTKPSHKEGRNPKCPKWLLSVRPEPAELANFFISGSECLPRTRINHACCLLIETLGC